MNKLVFPPLLTEINERYIKAQESLNTYKNTINLTNDISRIDGISIEDVSLIDELKPGLLSDNLSLNQFTKYRSSHFKKDVMNYLQKVVSTESNEVINNLCSLFSISDNFSIELHNSFRQNVLKELNSNIYTYRGKYKKLYCEYRTSGNFVIVHNGNEFINILTTPITKLPANVCNLDTSNEALLTIINGSLVSKFIESVVTSTRIEELICNKVSISENLVIEMTYKNLLNYYANDNLSSYINELNVILENGTELYNELKINYSKCKDTTQFFLENAESIRGVIDIFNMVFIISLSLLHLDKVIVVPFDILEQLV